MNYGGYGYAQQSYGYGMQQYANPYGYSTGGVAYGQQVQYGQQYGQARVAYAAQPAYAT